MKICLYGRFFLFAFRQACAYNPPMFPVVENGVAEGIDDKRLTIAPHCIY